MELATTALVAATLEDKEEEHGEQSAHGTGTATGGEDGSSGEELDGK